MKQSLYLSEPVRQGLGSCVRPGGEKLTERVVDFLAPAPEWQILDAGCGPGGTMDWLQRAGFKRLFGVDLDRGFLSAAKKAQGNVLAGDISRLPFTGGRFDLVFCECAWNLTDKDATLAEFYRVSKPGGYLALSDIFLRGTDSGGEGKWPVSCCFSQAEGLEATRKMVEKSGFSIVALEDKSRWLKQAAAEFVFAHGSLFNFWKAVTGGDGPAEEACRLAAAARPGLFLLVGKKDTR